MVPLTVVMPRVGSFALAFFGRIKKAQEPPFAIAAGRKSFALNRIFVAALIISARYNWQEYAFWTLRGALAQLYLILYACDNCT